MSRARVVGTYEKLLAQTLALIVRRSEYASLSHFCFNQNCEWVDSVFTMFIVLYMRTREPVSVNDVRNDEWKRNTKRNTKVRVQNISYHWEKNSNEKWKTNLKNRNWRNCIQFFCFNILQLLFHYRCHKESFASAGPLIVWRTDHLQSHSSDKRETIS